MSGVVNLHLLDERDTTYVEDSIDTFRRWTSTWFPFAATVQKNASEWDFVWRLHFPGGGRSTVAEGKAETRVEAFQAVADAKRAALAMLKEQLQ